jgi:hypothetical protein
MNYTVRTILGVLLIILAIITGPIPIIQGWVFFVAAIAVLGTDHPLVRWGVRKLEPLVERFAWARKLMDKMGLRKQPENAPPTA